MGVGIMEVLCVYIHRSRLHCTCEKKRVLVVGSLYSKFQQSLAQFPYVCRTQHEPAGWLCSVSAD